MVSHSTPMKLAGVRSNNADGSLVSSSSAQFWNAMGAKRAPVFALFMEHLLPIDVTHMIFQFSRTADLAYVQWKHAPTSARIFKPNGMVTDVSVGDFITTLFPSEFCFRIDEWRGDWKADGPTCFLYTVFDMKSKKIIEHEFTLKMGSTRHIICYPFGIAKYGNILSNNAWSSLEKIKDPSL